MSISHKISNPALKERTMKTETPPPQKHITNIAGEWRDQDIVVYDEFLTIAVLEKKHGGFYICQKYGCYPYNRYEGGRCLKPDQIEKLGWSNYSKLKREVKAK